MASEADLAPTGDVLRRQTYGYDPAGNLIAVDRPAQPRHDLRLRRGQPADPADRAGHRHRSITTSFGYDAAGNRTRYTDGRGNSTIYTFNTLGLPESVVEPSTTAHPAAADRTWTAGYDAERPRRRISAPRRGQPPAHLRRGRTGSPPRPAPAPRPPPPPAASATTWPAGSPAVSAPGGTNTYTYNDRGQVFTAAGPSGARFRYDDDGSVTPGPTPPAPPPTATSRAA